MALALQRRIPHIRDFPKRSCRWLNSSNRREARGFLVRVVLAIMYHHLLQSTVPWDRLAHPHSAIALSYQLQHFSGCFFYVVGEIDEYRRLNSA